MQQVEEIPGPTAESGEQYVAQFKEWVDFALQLNSHHGKTLSTYSLFYLYSAFLNENNQPLTETSFSKLLQEELKGKSKDFVHPIKLKPAVFQHFAKS